MEPVFWIEWLALGGLLGLVGQAIRVIPGMKKLSDRTAAAHRKFSDQFDWYRFGISLFFGIVAGVLAALTLDPGRSVDRKTVLALLAAGYAGTDFIEAFMRKSLLAEPNPETAPVVQSRDRDVA